MKIYCYRCSRLVADWCTGYRRKGAAMVCADCIQKYKVADQMAELARQQTAGMPEFMRDIFHYQK